MDSLNILPKKEKLATANDRQLLKQRTILLNTEFAVPPDRKLKVFYLITTAAYTVKE